MSPHTRLRWHSLGISVTFNIVWRLVRGDANPLLSDPRHWRWSQNLRLGMGSAVFAACWRSLISAMWPTVNRFNETPNAVVWSHVTAKFYAKAYDTSNQPLQPPPVLHQFTFNSTNQIYGSFTQGTSTEHVGRVCRGLEQLLIGQGLDFTVQTLNPRPVHWGAGRLRRSKQRPSHGACDILIGSYSAAISVGRRDPPHPLCCKNGSVQ